jgi:hypothetical protein
VIISDGGILAVPAKTNHNRENSATGYDHRIPDSAFQSLSEVFPPKPARTLSSGYEYNNAI